MVRIVAFIRWAYQNLFFECQDYRWGIATPGQFYLNDEEVSPVWTSTQQCTVILNVEVEHFVKMVSDMVDGLENTIIWIWGTHVEILRIRVLVLVRHSCEMFIKSNVRLIRYTYLPTW